MRWGVITFGSLIGQLQTLTASLIVRKYLVSKVLKREFLTILELILLVMLNGRKKWVKLHISIVFYTSFTLLECAIISHCSDFETKPVVNILLYTNNESSSHLGVNNSGQ